MTITSPTTRKTTLGPLGKTVLVLAAFTLCAGGCGKGLVSEVTSDAATSSESADKTGGPAPAGDSPSLTFKSISAGATMACGVRSDNAVICWGDNRDPWVIGTYRSVDVGGVGTWNCGVRMDGEVVCFDRLGAAITPETTTTFQFPPAGPFKSISTGYVRGCGVKEDGSLACWGAAAPDDIPPQGTFALVSVRDTTSCAIRSDGSVTCWDHFDTTSLVAPKDVRFSTISTGVDFACGVRSDNGMLACWGGGYSTGALTPPAGTFTAVSSGNRFACGIKTDQTLACWGNNTDGRATPPTGTFSALAAGYEFACGIRTDGTVVCWGNNSMGQTAPAKPDAGPTVTAATSPTVALKELDTGNGSACGVRLDGSLVCWGALAASKPPLGSFTSVSLGDWPCALTTDGELACWNSSTGELMGPAPTSGKLDGGEPFDPRSAPPGTYTFISVGGSHACGVKVDGSVACWGPSCRNTDPQPQNTFSSVSAGSSWDCGVTTKNELVCWNQFLGPGIPTPPSGSFTSVSVGDSFACALRTNGAIACWGDESPNAAAPPTGTFTAISTGGAYACGIRTDGTIACWGSNEYGRATPPPGTFTTISVSREFACAIRSDKGVACWGNDSSGEATPPAP